MGFLAFFGQVSMNVYFFNLQDLTKPPKTPLDLPQAMQD